MLGGLVVMVMVQDRRRSHRNRRMKLTLDSRNSVVLGRKMIVLMLETKSLIRIGTSRIGDEASAEEHRRLRTPRHLRQRSPTAET